MSGEAAGANPGDAERVYSALEVLVTPTSAPEQIASADAFLRNVRSSSAIWKIASDVAVNKNAPPIALHFAATAVEEKIRVLWSSIPEHDRVGAFNLALMVMTAAATKGLSVAVESSCTAAGICVARVSSQERPSAWQAAMAAARTVDVQCEMLGALIQEWDASASGSADRDKERRDFAKDQCKHAVGEASSVLSKPDSSATQKLAAVRCLRLWRAHAARGALIDILCSAVRDPELCEAAGEALEEDLADGDVGASAIVRMCEALRAVMNETGMESVQAHVIAVTCAAAAEGNIEGLLRNESIDRLEAAAVLVELLLNCLQSPRRSVGIAAVDGWTILAASAAALREESSSVHAVTDQLPHAVKTIITWCKLPPETDTSFWSDELVVDEAMHVRTFLQDALLEACIAMGTDVYIQCVIPLLAEVADETRYQAHPEEQEAVLFALAVGGEGEDSSQFAPHALESLNRALKIPLSKRYEANLPLQLAKTGMMLVQNYAQVIAQDDALFTICMQNLGKVLRLEPNSASSALYAVAQISPNRLMPHCDELLTLFVKEMDALSVTASTNIASALGTAAGELPTSEAQSSAIEGIVTPLSMRVQSFTGAMDNVLARAKLGLTLATLAAVLRSFNNPEASAQVIRGLSEPVSVIAMSSWAREDFHLVDSLCGLLEVAVAGRISDDETKRGPPNREVASAVLQLVADAFLSSRGSEPRWLRVQSEAVVACSDATPTGVSSVTLSVSKTVTAAKELLAVPDCTISGELLDGIFRVLQTTLAHTPEALATNFSDLAQIGILALNHVPVQNAQEVLRWWRSLMYHSGVIKSHVSPFLAKHGALLLQSLLVVSGSVKSRRLEAASAEVLMAVVFNSSEEFDAIAAIVSALDMDGVPVSWIQKEEKILLERCFAAVLSSPNKRRFKALLADMSRYCRREATFDVFVSYEMT
ncbi:hypothetical protein NDN08_004385 [Rhodosorus marinus]|uniref:Importin N-terminal domain-containing protein n=1 Tax=Rhodosorus marinus TaxID=101924 RepID=A0AAV8UL83_9RHOD|nr:hypothetical protein NDN08_004385 [Rhodosorus marinus]